MDRTGRQRQSRQWTQAIQTWEGEGGRAARPADEGISLRDDALPRGFLPSTIFS
jgi:hypothetical protein